MRLDNYFADDIRTAVTSTNPEDFRRLDFLTSSGTSRLHFGAELKQGSFRDLQVDDSDKEPHVIIVNSLDVNLNNLTHRLSFENVCVLIAHGGREQGQWLFGNNTPVVPTVLTYNQIAQINGLPQIAFLAVCNDLDRTYGSISYRGEDEIRRSNIVHPTFGRVSGHVLYKDGALRGTYYVADGGTFGNLEKLAQSHPATYIHPKTSQRHRITPEQVEQVVNGRNLRL